ncbi:MAG TPA: hypothetical protein VMX15_05555, partial [Candidatus Heimdallarchaeota archaeon]|nr:hypothetical protein [Candidatus Heimdallarchaeota archaeon]
GGQADSDVEVGSPERTHVATTNNKLIRLRRISAFLPPAGWGVSTGEPLQKNRSKLRGIEKQSLEDLIGVDRYAEA